MKRNKSNLRWTLFILIIMTLIFSSCREAQNVEEGSLEKVNGVEVSDRSVADLVEETGVERLVYVTIGDSMCMDFPYMLTDMMEEDLGVFIDYRHWWKGGDHSSDLLERIRTNEFLRADLHDADILTIEIPWNVMQEPCMLLTGQSDEGCQGMTPEECLMKAEEIYKSDTEAIFAEIVDICDPSKTLIRSMDGYQFFVNDTKEAGAFEIINECWRRCNENLIDVSGKYNIPTVRAYDAFMGEDGTQDPMDYGLVNDGKHQTDEGAKLIADLFRETGYDYAPEK